MRIFCNELYKVFIKRKIILLFIALIVIEMAGLCVQMGKRSGLDRDSYEVYRSYMNEFSGVLTEEKIRQIENIIEDREALEWQKSNLQKSYMEGNIARDAYKQSLQKLKEQTKGREGFSLFLTAFEDAVNTDTALADAEQWDILFGQNGADPLIVIAVTLLVSALSVYDDETGANKLQYCSLNGKSPLISVQIYIEIITVVFLCSLIFSGKYVLARTVFGLSGMDNPMYFCEHFVFSQWDFSLMEVYFYVCMIRMFGYVYASLLAMLIGQMCRSTLHTIFSTFVISFVPEYVLSFWWKRHLLPIPSSLLTADYLFSATDKCGLYVTDDGSTMMSSFAGNQLKVYFAIVGIVLFILVIGNWCVWTKRKRVS